MTDFEKFQELYESLGIPFEKSSSMEADDCPKGSFAVCLEAKLHKRLGGYNGFCTEIVFTEDGSFYKQYFWE